MRRAAILIVAAGLLMGPSACSMTHEEAVRMNASLRGLSQSADGWAEGFRQQGMQYQAPQTNSPSMVASQGQLTFRQVGDALMGSNGVLYRKVGNTIQGSDGTICQIVGQQFICK